MKKIKTSSQDNAAMREADVFDQSQPSCATSDEQADDALVHLFDVLIAMDTEQQSKQETEGEQ